MDEALEWLRRAPFRDNELELRQLSEPEDFGAEFTPEMQAREQALRDQVATQAQGAQVRPDGDPQGQTPDR